MTFQHSHTCINLYCHLEFDALSAGCKYRVPHIWYRLDLLSWRSQCWGFRVTASTMMCVLLQSSSVMPSMLVLPPVIRAQTSVICVLFVQRCWKQSFFRVHLEFGAYKILCVCRQSHSCCLRHCSSCQIPACRFFPLQGSQRVLVPFASSLANSLSPLQFPPWYLRFRVRQCPFSLHVFQPFLVWIGPIESVMSASFFALPILASYITPAHEGLRNVSETSVSTLFPGILWPLVVYHGLALVGLSLLLYQTKQDSRVSWYVR